MIFIFAILTQHHIQSLTMIIMAKKQFLKQFIIHHRNLPLVATFSNNA